MSVERRGVGRPPPQTERRARSPVVGRAFAPSSVDAEGVLAVLGDRAVACRHVLALHAGVGRHVVDHRAVARVVRSVAPSPSVLLRSSAAPVGVRSTVASVETNEKAVGTDAVLVSTIATGATLGASAEGLGDDGRCLVRDEHVVADRRRRREARRKRADAAVTPAVEVAGQLLFAG